VKPYLFLAPMAALSALLCYYPFARTLAHSLSVVNARGQITSFAGLGQYAALMQRPQFAAALRNTLLLALMNVPVTIGLTLACALLTGRRRRFGAVSELLLMLPMAASMSMASLVFKTMLSPSVGIVNYALRLDWGWFTKRQSALTGIAAVTVWLGLGFNYLLLLAAVRALPDSLMEAATLDGANARGRFLHISLPLLSPTVFYAALNNLVLSLMTAGPVILLTQGGPQRATTTLVYLLYASGYGSANYALAGCAAVTAIALTAGVSSLLFRLEKRSVHYVR